MKRIYMSKSIKELAKMFKDGKIHTNISTQRSFIYNDYKTLGDCGELTKSGDVIKTILADILGYETYIPVLEFWNVQDNEKNIHNADDEFNVHEGKQRFLSIMGFINPTLVDGKEVTTKLNINGEIKAYTFKQLPRELQEKFLNYTLDIMCYYGKRYSEEQSFIKINSSALPLTTYEYLKGAYYGEFLDEFENYINNLSSTLDHISRVGRGEQAIYFLYMCFPNLLIENANKYKLAQLVRDRLSEVRNNKFDKNKYKLDSKLQLFSDLARLELHNGVEKSPLKLARIVEYVISKGYNKGQVLAYYTEGINQDISKWDFETHKTAIDAYINSNIKLDFQRFFTSEDKLILFGKSHQCVKCGASKSYALKELEVDHVDPWSKGGRTNLFNAQLLCKYHNSSKNNKSKDNEEDNYYVYS